MPHCKDYDYDIFISFSHAEDASVEGAKGWVERFDNYLKDLLENKRGLKGIEIWRDRELGGNTRFDDATGKRIERSAPFFVFHSRDYRSFDHCR
jgi:hypothetical protein